MKALITSIILTITVITTQAADPTEGLPEAVKKIHNAQSCDKDLPHINESFQLGEQTLYIVPCSVAAYNSFSKVYIFDNRYGDEVEQVSILTYHGGVQATQDIFGASFDPETKLLTTFLKGRGIGDCGEYSKTQFFVDAEYGYISYYTTQINHKEACDGNFDDEWPVVFKQDVQPL